MTFILKPYFLYGIIIVLILLYFTWFKEQVCNFFTLTKLWPIQQISFQSEYNRDIIYIQKLILSIELFVSLYLEVLRCALQIYWDMLICTIWWLHAELNQWCYQNFMVLCKFLVSIYPPQDNNIRCIWHKTSNSQEPPKRSQEYTRYEIDLSIKGYNIVSTTTMSKRKKPGNLKYIKSI